MSQTVKVLEVTSVQVTAYKMLPPTLVVYADGVVPTTGYKNGQLIPYVYIQFPQDGIWDFDFVADKPDGPVLDVLSPIAASYTWYDYPKDLKGVRIHATCNSMEGKIGPAEKTVELRAGK